MKKAGSAAGVKVGGKELGSANGKATGRVKWTFMVTMDGDNNLDGAALRDIAEMARVDSAKDVNVLVHLDRIEDKLTRRSRITQGDGFKKDCIESFSAANTGDPAVLMAFIRWEADNYPADRPVSSSGTTPTARGRTQKAGQPVRKPVNGREPPSDTGSRRRPEDRIST